MGASAKHVAIGQGAQLGGDGVDQFVIAIPERGTPERRQALKIAISFIVIDINAFAANDVELFNLGEVCCGI